MKEKYFVLVALKDPVSAYLSGNPDEPRQNASDAAQSLTQRQNVMKTVVAVVVEVNYFKYNSSQQTDLERLIEKNTDL